jgi:Bacterial regulatory helix-turn-helix protein, lysR family
MNKLQADGQDLQTLHGPHRFMASVTFRQIRYFIAVAEAGKISAAASMIGISPSAVTEAINELTAVSGMKLFDRPLAPARLRRPSQYADRTGLIPGFCWHMSCLPERQVEKIDFVSSREKRHGYQRDADGKNGR